MIKEFKAYQLPIDINPYQKEKRHQVDYETVMEKVGKIENRFERRQYNGQQDD
jgi:hypothetical protein